MFLCPVLFLSWGIEGMLLKSLCTVMVTYLDLAANRGMLVAFYFQVKLVLQKVPGLMDQETQILYLSSKQIDFGQGKFSLNCSHYCIPYLEGEEGSMVCKISGLRGIYLHPNPEPPSLLPKLLRK